MVLVTDVSGIFKPGENVKAVLRLKNRRFKETAAVGNFGCGKKVVQFSFQHEEFLPCD